MPILKVVDPTVPGVTVERHQMADRPTTVNGMVVGFREFWPKFDVFTRAFEELSLHQVRRARLGAGRRHASTLRGGARAVA